MSRNVSQYAQRIAYLSSRIFGEPTYEQQRRGKYVIKRLSQEPYYKKQSFVNYYPPIYKIDSLMKKLRHYGLYVDEHLDFKDEMERQRTARGKGRKHREN